jgi:predicted ArsR family transcriptional regulator
MPVPVSVSQALKALMKCKQIPDADLAARLIEYLLTHQKGATMSELSKSLEISYPMVLKVVNELESLNVVETSKVKPEGGRGRAKKLVKLYKPMLKKIIEECKEILTVVEENL